MKIEYLADYPQYVPAINKWIYNEFGYLAPHRTEKDWLVALKKKLKKNQVPTSFIALSHENPIGFACLIDYDMDTHKHLTPWLAGVYVTPPERRKHVGTQLVLRVMIEAKNLDIKTLYLFTPDMKTFYEKLGWQIIEHTVYRGHQVDIMVVKLNEF